MVTSIIRPDVVELFSIENTTAFFKLRKNINTVEDINDFTGLSDMFYTYDELTLEITYKENALNDIINSFDMFWNLAEQQKEEKETLKEKEDQMNNLINNYALIEENNSLKNQLENANEVIGKLKEQLISTSDDLSNFMDFFFNNE